MCRLTPDALIGGLVGHHIDHRTYPVPKQGQIPIADRKRRFYDCRSATGPFLEREVLSEPISQRAELEGNYIHKALPSVVTGTHMNQRSGLDTSLTRRRLLAGVGALAGMGAIGYAGIHSAAKEGTINARFVIGIDRDGSGTIVGSTLILTVIGHTDSPPTRRIHPDYQSEFPTQPPMTVSASLHRTLQNDFDEIDYALSHSCPEADCSTPQVSRQEFNNARMGEEVRLVYHSGSRATVVP